MITTLIISIVTFVLIIGSIIFLPNIKFKKLSFSLYWVIALAGALALLIAQQVSFEDVWAGLTADTEINPIKVLVLFLSMTFISTFLDSVGFFSYLAAKAASKAKGSQLRLFIIIFVFVSLLTMFTSNDVVILTFTPFICYFAKRTNINPIPYLVMEFAAANTWSMMFIIGNPTNIYLGLSAGISFFDYFMVMAPATLVTGGVEILLLLLLFYKKLKEKFTCENDETIHINKLDMSVGIATLLVCLILLVVSSYVSELHMWLISLICAGFLTVYGIITSIIRKDKMHFLIMPFKHLPYALVPFVLSMFVIVIALTKQGITIELSNFFGTEHSILVYGISSFVSANIINNIPMSILYSSIIASSGGSNLGMIYGTVVGSNLGAFLTPIGALAGIMFTGLVKKQHIKYNFLDFIKYGAIISIPLLFVALGMLYLV